MVSFTITGTNDNPTVSATASAGFTEALNASAQNLSDNGTVSFDDIDTNDTVSISFASNNDIAGSNAAAPGTTPWSYSVNGANLDFLAAGETITFSYTVTATDNHGGTATTTVSFTITGTNDNPTVSATASAGFTEALNASAQNLSDNGTVSFDDIDTNDTVSISFASNNDIAWSNG